MAAGQCRACQPDPAEGDVGDRGLSDRGARRACGRLRQVRPPSHRLQLMQEPALPEAPGTGRARLDGGARRGPAAGRVFPRGLHLAGRDRADRLFEQEGGLWPAVPRLGRDGDDHCRRSQTPRREGRHDRRAAHLGLTAPDSSSNCLAQHRQGRACAARYPSDPGQLCHPQDARGAGLAGQAPALQAAFHADQRLMAEPCRTLLRRDHIKAHPTWQLRKRR